MGLGAGLCGALLRPLVFDNQDLHEAVLSMLVNFLCCLSPRSYVTALAVLVDGNVVELTMGHLMKTGVMRSGLVMLSKFWVLPEGQKRMCAPGVMDKLIAWIAESLQSVRNKVVVPLLEVDVRKYSRERTGFCVVFDFHAAPKALDKSLHRLSPALQDVG